MTPEQAQVELIRLLKEQALEEAKTSFYKFVRVAANHFLPEKFKDGAHIRLICKELQDIADGRQKSLMLALPPGSMKSVLVLMFATWQMLRKPKYRVMYISSAEELAMKHSRMLQDFVLHPGIVEIFKDAGIRKDRERTQEWSCTNDSSFYCGGAGKRIAGNRFELGILDDVVSEQTAFSDTEREAINKWYRPGFESRGLEKSAIVIINTRWHVRDLQGFLLDEAARNSKVRQWRVISIPAIVDPATAELLGVEDGGSYWPEMWSLEHFLTLKASKESLPPSKWAALYMQQPTTEEGALMPVDKMKWWTKEDPPFLSYICQSYDTAFSKERGSSFSVIQTWGVFLEIEQDEDGNDLDVPHVILLDQRRDRWTFPELLAESNKAIEKYKPDAVVIENKASGQSLIQSLQNMPDPPNVIKITPKVDKVARATPLSEILDAGRVWVPTKKKFVQDLIVELKQFPNSAYDDCVDTMSLAFDHMVKYYDFVHMPKHYEEEFKRKKRTYY